MLVQVVGAGFPKSMLIVIRELTSLIASPGLLVRRFDLRALTCGLYRILGL